MYLPYRRILIFGKYRINVSPYQYRCICIPYRCNIACPGLASSEGGTVAAPRRDCPDRPPTELVGCRPPAASATTKRRLSGSTVLNVDGGKPLIYS